MSTTTRPTTGFSPHTAPFTSRQAFDAGVSRYDLTRMVLGREIRRVMRDLYVPWDAPDTTVYRASAASLVLPPHAVAVDGTAAWVWGVDARRPWELDLPPSVEFFALRGNSRLRRREIRSGVRDLEERDMTSIDGLRITTPVRTSLDLACHRRRYEALAAMDGLARAQGVSADQLLPELARFRRRRGVVQARELVPLVDGRSESAGESFVRGVMHDGGLPAPTPQFVITVHGVEVARLDLAYPRLKICIEYDGEEYHSSAEQREADKRRRKWLRDRGWHVIVVRKDGLSGQPLADWLAELRDTISERSRH